jgi:predicted transposase YbfD/YdcC
MWYAPDIYNNIRWIHMSKKGNGINEHFSIIKDPRKSNCRHKLIDIITIALCAIICGCDTWVQVEDFGRVKYDWFKTFLELPHGIPSHDTFGRVFALIDPVEFQNSFVQWMKSIQKATSGQVVAIDGKTLRRSHDHAIDQGPIHIVSAWVNENQMVAGQMKTEKKSNEIKAIPKLLRLLDVTGCIVTIDAMGCQKNIARQIIDQGADYLLALKGNQGQLHQDIELFFQDAAKSNFREVPHGFHQTVDGDHGRVETRKYWITSDIEWLHDKEQWPGLTSVVMAQRERDVKGQVSVETRYYISSMAADPSNIAQAVRGHWGIENSLHWVLDVAFREDESRIRKDHAPENSAILRHIALNLLKKVDPKKSVKRKRLIAGWDNQFLANVLHAGF